MPRPSRARGVGAAMERAVFRDPVGVEAEADRIGAEIAAVLVKAPHLPIELPRFDLTLLSVRADKGGVELLLGKSSPLAAIRLERVRRSVESGDSLSSVVEVSVRGLHPDARRFDRALQAIRLRLSRSITKEQWERIREPAKRLAQLPIGVPLAFYRQLVPGIEGQGLVRTGFLCNQNCGICWQDRTWGRFDAEQVLMWIEDLRAAGALRLIISGGEPLLDPRLEDYVRRAREIGFESVTLETNAIQFARPGVATKMQQAGLSDCFVSLHSGDAATSDAITRAPGTFVRTVAGITALLEAGIPVRLNCVMTREGIEHLDGVPDFISATFGQHPRLQGLMLSQPTDPFDRSLLPTILPEPERLRQVLRRVIDRSFALGLEVSGLDGPCGPPLCAFGADRRITRLEPISEPLDGRVYLTACDACAVRNACFGVRVGDVELYGDACAAPLAELPPDPVRPSVTSGSR